MNNKKGFIPLAFLITILIVVAGGGTYYFVKQKQTKLVPIVENKTDKQIQESTTEASQDQSSVPDDWKTYRNGKYGFEFRYPPSMHLGGSDELVMILDKDKSGFSINVQSGSNPLLQSIKQLADEEFKEEGLVTYHSIGGVDSILGDGIIMFTKDTDVFIVSPNILWVTKNTLGEKTFDSILSTFRFIERDDAFRNKESCVTSWKNRKDYKTITIRYGLVAEDFCEAKIVPSQFDIIVARFTAEAFAELGGYPKDGSADEEKIHENKIINFIRNKVRDIVLKR